jgi:hypothetical protein
MCPQILVDDPRKVEERPLNRRTRNPGLVGCPEGDELIAGGNGSTGLTPRRVLDTALVSATLRDVRVSSSSSRERAVPASVPRELIRASRAPAPFCCSRWIP